MQHLLGHYVNWTTIDTPEMFIRNAGRGQITNLLRKGYVLVKRIPRKGDKEPDASIVLDVSEPTLHFFESLAEEERWYRYVMDEPDKIVSLVERRQDPGV